MLSRLKLAYAALLLLFAATVVYQAKAIQDAMRPLFHPERVARSPVILVNGLPIIRLALPEAAQAGIQQGDTLLRVNGKALTGAGVLGEVLEQSVPGAAMTLTMRRGDEPAERTFVVQLRPRLTSATVGMTAFFLVVYVAMPLLSVLLGFWVAAVRPLDRSAWLLLLLLLGFTTLVDAGITRWGSGWRDLGIVYYTALNNIWPISMLLFGVYFPEPFPPGGWRKLVKVMQWILIPPLAAVTVAETIGLVSAMENYAAMPGLWRVLNKIQRPGLIVTFAAIAIFFSSIAAKFCMAVSRDAKRRLQLTYLGSAIGLTPIFVLVLTALIMNKAVGEIFPEWMLLASLVLMFVFPLSLTYVILVHRALDVRVVLRQGLQYALAKDGVRVLQVLASAAVILAATTLAADAKRNRPQKISTIATGITVVFLLRQGADRLRAWTDRRFFRDAYNAEQILNELSESVRTMMESRPLLETVSRRISESLHVPCITVLLDSGGAFRPAYALGYSSPPEVEFSPLAATVQQLRSEKQPARIYFDDPDSWINRDGVPVEERASLAQLYSELLLPLTSRDKLLGFISLSQKRSEEPYSGSDLRLLQSVAAQTGLALENARLTAEIAHETAQRETLNRELEIAREVQERLFPQQLPPVAGLDYCGKCRPALGVGGDYYDFLALPGGKLGIAIGDVSGKGISAALMMASLQASLRGQALVAPHDLAKVVANVNRLVYEASAANRYATFFYAEYEPQTRTLRYVNAGHNPPLVIRNTNGSSSVTPLEVGGTVVGLLPDFPYQEGATTLACGDLLVAYTDGISEAMNPAGQEWGEECMLAVIRTCAGLSAAEVIQRVMCAADSFASGARQHDDMTLIAARVL
jgi:sigma-B regulation protein RsbU (phosphoserine phosphatase)